MALAIENCVTTRPQAGALPLGFQGHDNPNDTEEEFRLSLASPRDQFVGQTFPLAVGMRRTSGSQRFSTGNHLLLCQAKNFVRRFVVNLG